MHELGKPEVLVVPETVDEEYRRSLAAVVIRNGFAVGEL
jgi:hypothetical protein